MPSTAIRKVISSTGWLSMALGLGQVVNFLCVILAAKYLAPAEYGAYSTGMIIVSFTAILARFGILEALVQFGAKDATENSTAAWISLAFSMASWVVTGVAGLVLSIVWHAPSLPATAMALGISSLSYGLQSLPEALLRKELEFRRIALTRLAANLVGGAALVAWVLVAPSVWALVAQRVVTETTCALLLWISTRPPLRLRWSADYAGRVLHFSRSIGAANVVDVLGSQLDQIIVRAFWGDHGLGLYAMAKRLLSNVQQFLFLPFRQVAIAALAGLGGDTGKMRQAYLRGTRMTVAAGVLVAWMIFLGIDPVIQLLFSSQWLDCVVILKILCWVLIYDAIAVMYPAVLQAAGKPQWIVRERLALVTLGSIAMTFVALAGRPVQDAAYTVLLQSYLTLPLVFFFLRRVLGPAVWHGLLEAVVCVMLVSVTFLVLQRALSIQYLGTGTLGYMLKLSVPSFISITILACYLGFVPRNAGRKPVWK